MRFNESYNGLYNPHIEDQNGKTANEYVHSQIIALFY